MDQTFRSLLFMPASNARALEKAKGLEADALIFDLEDAVAPADKNAARENLAGILAARADYGTRPLVVRINAPDTPWYVDDIKAAQDFDAVLIPKVEDMAMLDQVAGDSGSAPLWAMIETPLGVVMASHIAGHPRLQALLVGTNDLAEGLGATVDAERSQLHASLQMVVLAGRARGVAVYDGVYNDIRNQEGFRAEVRAGKALGFDGKSLIHPAQIGPCHDEYAPSAEELEDARGLIAAYKTKGQGVATFKGKMIEELHVRAATKTIGRSR